MKYAAWNHLDTPARFTLSSRVIGTVLTVCVKKYDTAIAPTLFMTHFGDNATVSN